MPGRNDIEVETLVPKQVDAKPPPRPDRRNALVQFDFGERSLDPQTRAVEPVRHHRLDHPEPKAARRSSALGPQSGSSRTASPFRPRWRPHRRRQTLRPNLWPGPRRSSPRRRGAGIDPQGLVSDARGPCGAQGQAVILAVEAQIRWRHPTLGLSFDPPRNPVSSPRSANGCSTKPVARPSPRAEPDCRRTG